MLEHIVGVGLVTQQLRFSRLKFTNLGNLEVFSVLSWIHSVVFGHIICLRSSRFVAYDMNGE